MRQKLGLVVLAYLRWFARRKLAHNQNAVVVGITGSAGKTSTRLAVAKVLALRGAVKQSAHANSESGISLNILGITPRDYSLLDWLRMVTVAPWKLLIREQFDYYVVEMGIDSPTPPKNMEYLLSIVRPKVGVLLNVGIVHGANFDKLVPAGSDRERELRKIIAAEKFKMLENLPQSGIAIWNCDQAELIELGNKLKCKQIKVGRGDRADVRLVESRISASGLYMKIEYENKNYELQLTDPLPEHYGITMAMAVAVGLANEVKVDDAIKALESYRAPAGRLRVFKGKNGNQLLDSSYNASPGSMHDALSTLHQVANKGRRVAVLGDMRELGEVSEKSHEMLAREIMELCDKVILYGPQMKKYVLPVLEKTKFDVSHFEKMTDLCEYLINEVRDSWVLFKGSQNTIFMERAVEVMLAEDKDKTLLCRRGKYWDQLRSRSN